MSNKSFFYRTLSYTILIIAFVVFAIQVSFDFNQIFGIDIGLLGVLYPIVGVVFGFITISILYLISKIHIFILHDNVLNFIKGLIYLIVTLMFLLWISFLSINFLFILDGFGESILSIKFILKQFAMALMYSSFVNLFFFSLSIPVLKENKNEL